MLLLLQSIWHYLCRYSALLPNESFVVELVKRLASAKADFKNALAYYNGHYDNSRLSVNILKAILDAGADPDKFSGDRTQSILFELLEHPAGPPSIEKIKLLVEHKASLTKGIYGFRDHAMCFFLQHRGLDNTSTLPHSNPQLIFSVIDILRGAGADTGDAKNYLATMRDKYRNIPDALNYINDIEKRIDKSMLSAWWDSLTGWGQDKTASPSSSSSSLLAAAITANKVNVRNSPVKGRVLFQVSMSDNDRLIVDKTSVKDNGEDWYRARYIRRSDATGKVWYDKAGGYIAGRFLRLEGLSAEERKLINE